MNWQTKKKAEEIKELIKSDNSLKSILEKKFARSKKKLSDHIEKAKELYTEDEMKYLLDVADVTHKNIEKSKDIRDISKNDDKSVTVLQSQDGMKKLINIVENSDKLNMIFENFEKIEKILSGNSHIDELLHIPESCLTGDKEIHRGSFRVIAEINKRFDEFCNKNKDRYSKISLLSHAMEEYMNRYDN